MFKSVLISTALLSTAFSQELQPPARAFPPVGDKINEEGKAILAAELEKVTKDFATLPKRQGNANAEIFIKAVKYALDYSEFYGDKDRKIAGDLLEEAARRIESLKKGKAPWMEAKGYVVRGYYSPIDGSAQPFGLEIPEDAPDKAAPAWLWLQGRGENRTDLHFISQRMSGSAKFQPAGTIVVHPWGRFCTGTKNAGEQDVLNVRELLVKEGRIDPKRVALCGFSMGGGGTWMIGAHYTDKWAVVHPGAGFVEVRKFQKVSDEVFEKMPWWVKTLWGQNDVPDYARNLLNVPVFAYSGEIDGQREAAEIMTEVLAKEGMTLKHFIGPNTKHDYETETRKEVEAAVQGALFNAPKTYPLKLTFQTKTLDYSEMYWIQVTGLEEHWKDSRVDAELDAPIPTARKAVISTKNVRSLKLRPGDGEAFGSEITITIDGQEMKTKGSGKALLLSKVDGKWRAGARADTEVLRKRPGLQGPIDDVFTVPFMYVLPDSACATPELDAWVKEEIAYQTDRWRYLMRGDVRSKKASELTQEDVQKYNLVLWGDAKANPLIGRLLEKLPVEWSDEKIAVGGKSVPSKGHVLAMIYPNPFATGKYVVLNSGMTFRENQKSNALQNPQLPDWAIIDLSTPPDGWLPGKIVAADFFDENWKVK